VAAMTLMSRMMMYEEDELAKSMPPTAPRKYNTKKSRRSRQNSSQQQSPFEPGQLQRPASITTPGELSLYECFSF
jgi:hypothetical protein